MLLRAAERLSISKEILEHENAGLKNALISEQRRRKRGKKMGIMQAEEPGQAVFASLAKIAAIRARREEEEAQKAETEAEKEREKVAKAAARDKKVREAQERAEERKRMYARRKAFKEEVKEARR